MRTPIKHPAHANGFTLLEAATALLILSVGLLGVAFMQTIAMQHVQNAYNRSQINGIVADMIDRMRTHAIPASDPISIGYTSAVSNGDLAATTCPLSPGVSTTLRKDTVCFYQNLRNLLASANMDINVANMDGDAVNESYVINVYWGDRQFSRINPGEDAEGDEDTNTDTDTEGSDCTGNNRIWSGDLTWPGSTDPELCLISHSWVVQVMERT